VEVRRYREWLIQLHEHVWPVVVRALLVKNQTTMPHKLITSDRPLDISSKKENGYCSFRVMLLNIIYSQYRLSVYQKPPFSQNYQVSSIDDHFPLMHRTSKEYQSLRFSNHNIRGFFLYQVLMEIGHETQLHLLARLGGNSVAAVGFAVGESLLVRPTVKLSRC